MNQSELNGHEIVVRQLIQCIGDDPEREGLKDTPKRVVRSWATLFGGYLIDPKEALSTTFTDVKCDEMVVLRNIEFYSTCEHHMLPFFGVAHIGYIPDKCVVGISKLARLLEVYARRLQIQERICTQVTSSLMEFLKPRGAGCVIQSKHLCMTCRGVEKQNSSMITSSLAGVFREDGRARDEFLSFIR